MQRRSDERVHEAELRGVRDDDGREEHELIFSRFSTIGRRSPLLVAFAIFLPQGKRENDIQADAH